MIDTNNLTIRFCWGTQAFRFRPLRMLKHFKQRWTRGFDDSELWSLDWTIAKFVLPRLKAFREMGKAGCPAEFLFGDGTDAEIEAGQAHFMALVDKMIYAFECKVHDDTGLPEFLYEAADAGPYGEGYTIANFEEYKAALATRQVLIDEGLMLFAKYMHHLWD